VGVALRKRSDIGGLFIAEPGATGGGRGQWQSELAVAVANGLARADIGAAWKGDAGALASAEGQQAREKGGCEREVFWNAFLVQASLGFR
jgi:hypothetical protein